MTEDLNSKRVIRLGLSGHRPSRLDPLRLQAVDVQIQSVLTCVEDAFAPAQAPVDASTMVLKRFTCGMAPGADVIGAKLALNNHWELQAILAGARDAFIDQSKADLTAEQETDYETGVRPLLEHSSSVLELDVPQSNGLRRDVFELVGEIILEQSDILIVVWDGKPARGLGGTAHVARRARDYGMPLVWIHATKHQPPQIYLPGQPVSADMAVLADWLRNRNLVPAPVALADALKSKTAQPAAAQRMNEFHAERATRTGWFPPLFHWLLMLGGKGLPRWPLKAHHSRANWDQNWSTFRNAVQQFDTKLADAVETELHQPFMRADHLAEVYGRAYRGTYVAIYLLAGLATLVGLLGLFVPEWKLALVWTELLMILLMACVAVIGKRGRWHERWLEYRALAEQLRQARMGVWCGQSLEGGHPEDVGNSPAAAWVGAQVSACVRRLPLINTSVTPDYVRLAIKTVGEIELDEQHRFNRRTCDVQEHVNKRLEWIEEILFGLLVLACIGFLLVYSDNPLQLNDQQLKHLGIAMTFFGALVPALGAALLGVRSQGEFGAYAERCADTSGQLQPVLKQAAILLDTEAKTQPGFQDLVELIDLTSAALANDVYAWRTLYRRKQLTVSA